VRLPAIVLLVLVHGVFPKWSICNLLGCYVVLASGAQQDPLVPISAAITVAGQDTVSVVLGGSDKIRTQLVPRFNIVVVVVVVWPGTFAGVLCLRSFFESNLLFNLPPHFTVLCRHAMPYDRLHKHSTMTTLMSLKLTTNETYRSKSSLWFIDFS
jgi:hypothetical protein